MMEFFRKLNWLVHRRRREQELREELQFHLDEEAEDQQDRDSARRELGNMTQVLEDARSAWGWTLVEQLAQDLRYAFRTMLGISCFHYSRSSRWPSGLERTRRFTALWIRSCCALYRSPIPSCSWCSTGIPRRWRGSSIMGLTLSYMR
jgi:hypothetical protein